MIITFDDLAMKYKDYTDIKGKIRRDIQTGVLTQVTRGVYESNANTDGKYLAGLIYGPSYLSFDYALCLILKQGLLILALLMIVLNLIVTFN